MHHSGLILFLFLFPYPSHQPLPHMCLRNAYEGYICFYLCSPTPSTTRSHACAYVTRMKDNFPRSFEPRHLIPDTRISSGQCPRCGVNVALGSRDFKVIRNKWDLRHIHVKMINIFIRITGYCHLHMWRFLVRYIYLEEGHLCIMKCKGLEFVA
jgi:hypothetical protein